MPDSALSTAGLSSGLCHALLQTPLQVPPPRLQCHLVWEPYHTSTLTGQGWVDEPLDGHPERIRTELGMHKHAFLALLSKLQDLGHTSGFWAEKVKAR
jgi:hypothetical protein